LVSIPLKNWPQGTHTLCRLWTHVRPDLRLAIPLTNAAEGNDGWADHRLCPRCSCKSPTDQACTKQKILRSSSSLPDQDEKAKQSNDFRSGTCLDLPDHQIVQHSQCCGLVRVVKDQTTLRLLLGLDLSITDIAALAFPELLFLPRGKPSLITPWQPHRSC
jgi:hypothetical protein